MFYEYGNSIARDAIAMGDGCHGDRPHDPRAGAQAWLSALFRNEAYRVL